jgi:nucleotide-binding universal stress UspA family protein
MAARRPRRHPRTVATLASHVACGVDRSPQARAAARFAAQLAQALARPLVLMHAQAPAPSPAPRRPWPAPRQRRPGWLAELASELPVAAETEVVAGTPVEGLAGATRDGALVVVGSRGEGALRQTLLGSVALGLLRRGAGPAVVLPPAVLEAGLPLRGRCVICGVRSPDDAGAAALAHQFATALDVTLVLAHAVAPVPAAALPTAVPMPVLETDEAGAHERGRELIGEVSRAAGLDRPGAHAVRVLDGVPAEGLSALAAHEDAALLAVGPSPHGTLFAALTGSPVRHLIRHGTHPVLVAPRAGD